MRDDPQRSDSAVLRMGVVGCGQVFKRLHLPAIRRRSDVRLASAAEPSPQRREWLADAFPGLRIFEDAGRLITEADLDAVLICTPTESHALIALAALRQGLHVLVEKPMATNVQDARAIVETSLDADRAVVVGFNRRFRRTYRELRHNLAARPTGPDRIRFVFQADASRWDRFPEADAPTILNDVASHQLDLIPWLVGRPIEEVRARLAGEETGRDALTIDLRLEGGMHAELRAGYGSGYVERLDVEDAHGFLVAYPEVLIDPSRIGRGPMRIVMKRPALVRSSARVLGGWNMMSRRLFGRPSLTQESVELQLADFATRILSRSTAPEKVSGANARDGMQCALAVTACLRSLQQGGRWQAIDA